MNIIPTTSGFRPHQPQQSGNAGFEPHGPDGMPPGAPVGQQFAPNPVPQVHTGMPATEAEEAATMIARLSSLLLAAGKLNANARRTDLDQWMAALEMRVTTLERWAHAGGKLEAAPEAPGSAPEAPAAFPRAGRGEP